MLTPHVPFDAAEPPPEAVLADVAEDTTHPEYVYFSLVVVFVFPIANIPTLLLPAADPQYEVALEAVAEDTTQPEYVYLFLVVDGESPAL